MASKSPTTTSTLLIILLLLITFPFWIGIIALIGGILAGVFGAIFGIIGGVFGALSSIFTWPFKMLFGWHDWWPHFHFNGFVMMALIILVVLISGRNRM